MTNVALCCVCRTCRMLRLRCISKPVYRWAFRQGDRMTASAIKYFTRKYIIKYLRKRRKLKIELMDDAVVSDVTARLMHVLVEDPAAPVPEDLDPEVVEYAFELFRVARTNEGLAHSKVREYWLYRGPRYTAMFLAFVLCCTAVEIFLAQSRTNERAAQFIVWTLALLFYMAMLYFRLPDSIHAAVSRSTHDFYGVTKRRLHRIHGWDRSSSTSSGPYSPERMSWDAFPELPAPPTPPAEKPWQAARGAFIFSPGKPATKPKGIPV